MYRARRGSRRLIAHWHDTSSRLPQNSGQSCAEHGKVPGTHLFAGYQKPLALEQWAAVCRSSSCSITYSPKISASAAPCLKAAGSCMQSMEELQLLTILQDISSPLPLSSGQPCKEHREVPIAYSFKQQQQPLASKQRLAVCRAQEIPVTHSLT